MVQDCIFCKIASGAIATNKVYEDDDVMAFEDISPQAPVHILIITKQHVENVDAVLDEHQELLGKLLLTARDIAREKKISESGYRLILNTNPDSGQEVYHIHMHLLGGRKFMWPPG